MKKGARRTVKIREAGVDDIGPVAALLADDEFGRGRERIGEHLDAAYVEAFESIERDGRNHLIVAEEGGRVVGTLQLTYVPSLTHRGGERAQIEGVRVAASHRGAGVGSLLVEWAISQASQRGCRMIQLTTDKRRPEARRFYESHGFEATHEGMKLHVA